MRNVCPFYMTLFVLMLQNQICVHTFLGGKFYSSQPTSKPFLWAWRPKIRVSRGPPIHSGRNFLLNQITVKNFIQNELLFCLFTFALFFYRSKTLWTSPQELKRVKKQNYYWLKHFGPTEGQEIWFCLMVRLCIQFCWIWCGKSGWFSYQLSLIVKCRSEYVQVEYSYPQYSMRLQSLTIYPYQYHMKRLLDP